MTNEPTKAATYEGHEPLAKLAEVRDKVRQDQAAMIDAEAEREKLVKELASEGVYSVAAICEAAGITTRAYNRITSAGAQATRDPFTAEALTGQEASEDA